MIIGKKNKEELERLQESEIELTGRVSELEESNRLLTEALERNREELQEALTRLQESEIREGRLLLDLEREKARAEELTEQLSDAIDVEKEAARLDNRLNQIANERANFQAKIRNLEKVISELRNNESRDPKPLTTLDFTDLEEERPIQSRPAKKPRPIGEPFRPSAPPTDRDRQWLTDLPPF